MSAEDAFRRDWARWARTDRAPRSEPIRSDYLEES